MQTFENNKRALRRHHAARLKKNRKNYWGGITQIKQLGKVLQYPAHCSCPMCGNARHHFHALTQQELRHLEAYHSGLLDLFSPSE